MKNGEILKLVTSIFVFILSFLCLFNIINSNIGMPIVLFILGILNISNAYSCYIKEKKGGAIFLALCGMFIIFVALYTVFI